MKVLLSDTTYSYLFPGGKQVHANKLYNNLKALGYEVEYENWHDPNQSADIIHFFGYNDFFKIEALKKKGYKLVYTHIMDGLTNQPEWKLKYHKIKNKFIKILPAKFNVLFPWRVLNLFDAIVYMHKNDRDTAVRLYDVDINKTHIIPHAVDSLEPYSCNINESSDQEKYLVSLGSVIERKNTLYTAEICIECNIPIKFIGHPFDEKSDYFKKFISLTNNKFVDYMGFMAEMEKIKVLKDASGFVLLSFGESGCISVYEAAATGLPLLLSDLPWAKGYESPNHIDFCSPKNKELAKKQLSAFYEKSKRQTTPTFVVHTWSEIAKKYGEVYSSIKNGK
jgi:glycosyltransferase involved in cell wall biosynthesis